MKTNNLDEAVYLVTCGFKYTKVRTIADLHSEWTFEDSWLLRKAVKDFWCGTPKVYLDKWLNIRTYMKREQKMAMSIKRAVKKQQNKAVSEREMKYPKGTVYWFINSHNAIQSCIYGKAKSHNVRLAGGNFFLNRIQAVAKLKEKTGV